MGDLAITLGCGAYDRTRALANGDVRVEGVNLRYVPLEPEEVFFRMTKHREFDVAELSLSTYLVTMFADAPFVAIPVFPSRLFRHSSIYVNASAGIDSPSDLAGRLVGVAEYQLTANVWVRGILEEYYGVPATSVRYRTGGLNQPGRTEKAPVVLPSGLEVKGIASDQTLSELLVAGEIDAIYSPRAPDPFIQGHPNVRRLFHDVRSEEIAYYRRSGVFPIMHVVVIRRDVYESNRWLARSLTKAFIKAKALAVADLSKTAALAVMLPWLNEELRDTVSLLGDDFWPYGLEANRRTLDVFAGYSYDQGLSQRRLAPEELFAPEAVDDVLV